MHSIEAGGRRRALHRDTAPCRALWLEAGGEGGGRERKGSRRKGPPPAVGSRSNCSDVLLLGTSRVLLDSQLAGWPRRGLTQSALLRGAQMLLLLLQVLLRPSGIEFD